MAEEEPHVMIDETRFPVVRATWPHLTTDDALERYMAFVVARLEKRERFAIVVDGRIATGMTRAQQKRVGQMLDQYRPLTSQYIVMALVIANPLARVSLQAINALHPPPFPQRVFANTDEGIRWAELELSAPKGNKR